MEKSLRPDEAVLVSWCACRYQCSSQVEGIESLKKSEVQGYLVTSRHSSEGLKHSRFYRSKGLCREMLGFSYLGSHKRLEDPLDTFFPIN